MNASRAAVSCGTQVLLVACEATKEDAVAVAAAMRMSNKLLVGVSMSSR